MYRGRVLRDSSAKLCDLCADGGVLVVLPGRQAAPRPSPPAQPPRVRRRRRRRSCWKKCVHPRWVHVLQQLALLSPARFHDCRLRWSCLFACLQPVSIRDINVAIRADLAHQSPGTVAAAEAAARREQQRQMQQQAQAQVPAAGVPLPQLLEQALLSGEMSALRGYLEQLQAALQAPGQQQQRAAGGLGGGLVPQAAMEAATAALFGLPLGAAAPAPGGVAALGLEHGGEGSEDGDEDGEGSDLSDEHGGYLAHPGEPLFPSGAEGLEGLEDEEEEDSEGEGEEEGDDEDEEEYTDEEEEGYGTDDGLEEGQEEEGHELRGPDGQLLPPQVRC